MTFLKNYACYLLVLSFWSTSLLAQETELNQTFKKETIQQLSELINAHYVFPDIAKETEEHLNDKLKTGGFDEYKTIEEFAKALTTEVQSVNKDKHMRIRPNPPYKAVENTPARLIEEKLNRLGRSRNSNGGFNEVKKLEGNVGYLDLRGFAGPQLGIPLADSYMKLLSKSDAIIVDLRKNGGGSPAMVQYLCSYFFDEKIHLNSLYWRRGDRTEDFYTLDTVNGKKLPDVPLFIMTSNYTFSGAEEFSYNMQTRKRATLVGETTGGGANPGGMFPINKELAVFIPTGKAINPVTKTNWEGVGVIPEVKVSPEEVMDKTHELAKKAADQYRDKTTKKNEKLLGDLFNSLEKMDKNSSFEEVSKHFEKCLKANLTNEDEINQLGYTHLYEMNKPSVAEVIFKVNTQLFPESANVYDSYGESLAHNGKKDAAIKSYKKAIELAKKNNDQNLKLFEENLTRLQSDRP